MNRVRRVPSSSIAERRGGLNRRSSPSNREPNSKVVRRNSRGSVEQSVDVLEVFRSDGIDITTIDRNYYVEAFTLYMTANMPPILGYLEIPYELIGTLEQLTESAKVNLEEGYNNPSNYTEDGDYMKEYETYDDTEGEVVGRESYRSGTSVSGSARNMGIRQQPGNTSSGRSVRVRTSKSRRTGGGREW